MSSRSLIRVRFTHLTSRGRALRISGVIQTSAPFSQGSQRSPRRQESESSHSEPPKRYDAPQQKPAPGSIRPFTILLLCIPFGYGANWALKQQDATSQTSPDGFVKYTLASKADVSSTCSIFTLKPTSPVTAIDVHAPELRRSITSVQFKQPQLQIARSYTLLPSSEGGDEDEDELRFLIKIERRGEVSGYLHRLPLGAELAIRGINREFVVPEGVEKVVFLAGGTGIAPALQVAKILKDDEADVHVLWANVRREDCAGGVSDTRSSVTAAASWWDISRIWSSHKASSTTDSQDAPLPTQPTHSIVRDLVAAKSATNASGRRSLRVDYFVDEEDTFIQPRVISPLLHDAPPGRKLLIVSGPEGFVNYWAGPKQWLNGREVQGPLAGALDNLGIGTGWEVVKL